MAREKPAFRGEAAGTDLIKRTLRLLHGEEDRDTPLGFIRSVAAMNLLAGAARDDHTIDNASDVALDRARYAAGAASGSAHEVAAKLAYVVQQLAGTITEETGPGDMMILSMAASALADLVVLGDRPIVLPPMKLADRRAKAVGGRLPAEPQ